MFTAVGSLLKTLPHRSKTSDAIFALYVRKAFGDALNKTCGDLSSGVLKTICASTFKNGVLTVKAPQLAASELTMRAGGLIREINKLLGRNIVHKIRFRNF